MTDKPEGPIQRWSRLKRTRTIPREKTGRGAAAPVLPEEADGREVAALTDSDERENTPAPQEPQEPDALPDIDSLDKDSDFSAFLRQGVPEEIRRRALRVLWRSDPVLANLDGLNDYDEDFTVVHTVADAVRTAYKVGKGYLDDEDEAKATDQAGAAEEAAEPADAARAERIAASESDQMTDEGTSTKPDTDTAGEGTVGGRGRDHNKT